MGTEWIRGVHVRSDGVYLHSKSNNDDRPYRLWHCDSLTKIYQTEGQQGLDREIVRMLYEYAEIRGCHPSMERYRPCVLAQGRFSIEHAEILNAEYAKLTPEDLATKWFPAERQTSAMRAYKQFADIERDKYYTLLAGCAAPLGRNKTDRRRDEGAR